MTPRLTPARQISGRWLLVISVGAVIISLAFVGVAFEALSPSTDGTMFGTFFVNEGGYSNATASVTASYNLTLIARSGNGTILFTFLSGTNVMQQDLAKITNYTISVNQISMTFNGHSIVMPWEDNDTVWGGLYNSNYIASWGPTAPSYEMRGTISPAVFGLPSHDYIEFRFEAAGGEPNDDF
jgi:hypothetical protein